MPLSNAHFILLTVKLLHTLAITKCSLMRFPPSNWRSAGRRSCIASSLLHSPPSHEVIGRKSQLVSQCCCRTAASRVGWRETLILAQQLCSERVVLSASCVLKCLWNLQYRTCPVSSVVVVRTITAEFKSKNVNLFKERPCDACALNSTCKCLLIGSHQNKGYDLQWWCYDAGALNFRKKSLIRS